MAPQACSFNCFCVYIKIVYIMYMYIYVVNINGMLLQNQPLVLLIQLPIPHLPALSWASTFAPFSKSRSAILAMPSDEVILDELPCWEVEDADHGLKNTQYGFRDIKRLINFSILFSFDFL